MNIGILSRSTQLYSTRSLYKAGRRRGHMMYVIDHTRCDLLLENENPDIFYQSRSLQFLDAIIPRIGASVTSIGAAVIKQFEVMGIPTCTTSDALLSARDKMRCLQELATAGVLVPKTLLLNRNPNFHQLTEQLGGLPIVVKKLESTHGMGVELATSHLALATIVQAYLQSYEPVMLQEFIAEANGADTRVIMVKGEVVAAMQRQAQHGEFRSNLHRGASAIPVTLTEKEIALAKKVVEVMKIDVAGVDILSSPKGPLVMEVNASPGLEGIESVTEIDVAGQIIQCIEQKVKEKRSHEKEMKQE